MVISAFLRESGMPVVEADIFKGDSLSELN